MGASILAIAITRGAVRRNCIRLSPELNGYLKMVVWKRGLSALTTGAVLLLPLLTGLGLYLIFSGQSEVPWAGLSFRHPLGTDEFGRDVLATVFAATGLSLFKGIVVTTVTLTSAVIVAEVVTLPRTSSLAMVVRAGASIVESVPVVLWVFIALIAVPGPRLVVVGFAFMVVVLPISAHVLAGEFSRLRDALYVEAAYLAGASELRVLARYILPNAKAVLLPFALQVLGAAIAVDGAIGVIGLGNRSDLDLGIFLLRGKESFFLHPQILVLALLMYLVVYGYLLWFGSVASRQRPSNGEVMQEMTWL